MFCDDNNIERDTVVDVGCGSGQSTFHWAPHFNKVLGIDISHSQIQCAKDKLLEHAINNVEFKVGAGEALPLPDSSVDMLSFGTCWHWMNWDKVIPEIRRVLKAQGCVAIYAYLVPQPVHPKCSSIHEDFVQKCVVPYFPTSHHYFGGYQNSPHPFPLAKRCDWTMNRTYSFEEFRRMIESVAAYAKYKKDNPDLDALDEMLCKFKELLPEGEDIIEVTFPVCLLLFKN